MAAPRKSLALRALNSLGIYTRGQIRGGRQRNFDLANFNRLTADWVTTYLSGDAELRGPLRRIIARVQDLANNNDYVRGFLIDLENNVIGSAEFDLRMDVADILPGGVKRPDDLANRIIENAWLDWCKPKNASVEGMFSWRDLKRLALRSVPVHGAVLYQHVRGNASGNKYGYAVRLVEVMQLALEKHENTKDGGRIRFGIEKDPAGRLVAFHVYKAHPGDDIPQPFGDVERIPATEMGILQLPERVSRTIGISWFISAANRLRHLGAFEEAEVIAARVAASGGGWFVNKSESGPGYPKAGDGQQLLVDAEPGVWEELPFGVEPVERSPTHPNANMGDFRKAMLRGVAYSVGRSYSTLGNDLEAVNMSSGRLGIEAEREVFKSLQLWFKTYFNVPIFEEWLTMAMSTGSIALPLSKFDKFNAPDFKCRRWGYMDPLKDTEAKVLQIEKGLSSRTTEIENAGGDIEDVFDRLKAEKALAEKNGLVFPTGTIKSDASGGDTSAATSELK